MLDRLKQTMYNHVTRESACAKTRKTRPPRQTLVMTHRSPAKVLRPPYATVSSATGAKRLYHALPPFSSGEMWPIGTGSPRFFAHVVRYTAARPPHLRYAFFVCAKIYGQADFPVKTKGVITHAKKRKSTAHYFWDAADVCD